METTGADSWQASCPSCHAATEQNHQNTEGNL